MKIKTESLMEKNEKEKGRKCKTKTTVANWKKKGK